MGLSPMYQVGYGTVVMSNDKTTLSTGKYSIEQSDGAAIVYAENERGDKEWLASTTDLVRAMEIVEGLVLVEMKRFYYPESGPDVTTNEKSKLVPPFLQKKDTT